MSGFVRVAWLVVRKDLRVESRNQEMLLTTTSERQGRVIDNDDEGGMEDKKREGYF